MKSQLRHQNDRPHTVTASSKFHGGREHAHAYLEDTSGARQGGQATVSSSDHRSVHDYLKTAQADFAGLEQQQQQEGDFPAVWGESKVSGKPVRFEEDASGTQAVVVGGARGSGAFPYQYEQPAGSIPEVVVPSTVGKKHHGRKKMGVARPSPRSGLVQKVLHALAAFIPLGLFLASIQPSVITVNSSAPAPGVSRQRSVVGGSSDELLAAGAGADCEARLLCEAAVRGRLEAADAPERALWLAAHQTPDKMAVALGLYDVLKAIRTGTCDLYSCRAMQDEPFGSPT
ncbi:uncharacterized protein LOC126425249 [Schistocerca serialis cubense]|uniref:uncharacterized protein LOC126425249 n=1 Tax=Schistocerca serialis cubense TaxID=2023355 RepID=UPI00214F4B2E|nr:uncharacterized protein LOC126425249 [Schistocerca serialis cubense]